MQAANAPAGSCPQLPTLPPPPDGARLDLPAPAAGCLMLPAGRCTPSASCRWLEAARADPCASDERRRPLEQRAGGLSHCQNQQQASA